MMLMNDTGILFIKIVARTPTASRRIKQLTPQDTFKFELDHVKPIKTPPTFNYNRKDSIPLAPQVAIVLLTLISRLPDPEPLLQQQRDNMTHLPAARSSCLFQCHTKVLVSKAVLALSRSPSSNVWSQDSKISSR